MKEDCSNKITFEYLKSAGWFERGGIMVRFTHPRIGYKSDGTLIIGYHEYPEKIFNISRLNQILDTVPDE